MADILAPIKTVVYDPIFKQKVQIFCNLTEADLTAWEKKVGVSNSDGLNPNTVAFSTHYSSTDAPNIYLIWLNRFDWTIDDQDSLIHEIVHTIVRIWQANNIQFVPETQEFFASSVGGLYALIATKLMVRPKKKLGVHHDVHKTDEVVREDAALDQTNARNDTIEDIKQ